MVKQPHKKQGGFSLVELLLLLTVAAVFFSVAYQYDTRRADRFKIEKVALEMQTIMNAAMLYYVKNGEWPDYQTSCTPIPLDGTGTSALQDATAPQANFLSQKSYPTPFASTLAAGDEYYIHLASEGADGVCTNFPAGTFGVMAYFTSDAAGVGNSTKTYKLAKSIANKLSYGFIDGEGKYIGAYIYPPGQDPDTATGLNFAGVYHHGACIPVPDCPAPPTNATYTYSAQVFVSPTSVSGVNDTGSTNVYPISSFTAYAQGPGSLPDACIGAGTQPACTGGTSNGQYWRACLQIITNRGDVSTTRMDDWGDQVSIAAFTRCAISDEPVGTVFSDGAGVGYGD